MASDFPFATGAAERNRNLFVAVILGAVLHHLPDAADPAGIVARVVDAVSPGSYVAITHFWDPGVDSPDHALAREVERRFVEKGLGSGWYRSRAEIESFFAGLELVDPGMVQLDEWWPSGPAHPPATAEERLILGGVGRKGGLAVVR